MIHMYIIVVNLQMGDFFFPSIKVYIIYIHLVASSRTHHLARSRHTTSSMNRNVTSSTSRNPTVGTYRNPNCGGTRQTSPGRCMTSWNPPGRCNPRGHASMGNSELPNTEVADYAARGQLGECGSLCVYTCMSVLPVSPVRSPSSHTKKTIDLVRFSSESMAFRGNPTCFWSETLAFSVAYHTIRSGSSAGSSAVKVSCKSCGMSRNGFKLRAG